MCDICQDKGADTADDDGDRRMKDRRIRSDRCQDTEDTEGCHGIGFDSHET